MKFGDTEIQQETTIQQLCSSLAKRYNFEEYADGFKQGMDLQDNVSNDTPTAQELIDIA